MQLCLIVNLASCVVQGSVISSLLFLLFVTDVFTKFATQDCTCQLYANDLKLYLMLNVDSNTLKLQEWLDAFIHVNLATKSVI